MIGAVTALAAACRSFVDGAQTLCQRTLRAESRLLGPSRQSSGTYSSRPSPIPVADELVGVPAYPPLTRWLSLLHGIPECPATWRRTRREWIGLAEN